MVIRRKWIWLDWILLTLHVFWFVTGIAFFFGKPEEIGNPSTAQFFLTFPLCFAVPLLFWRPGYTHLVLFPLSILFTTGLLNLVLTWQAQTHTGLLLPFILLVGYQSHRRTFLWWIGLFVVGMALMDLVLIDAVNPANWINGFANSSALFMIGYVLNRILTSNLKMKELLTENERHKHLIEEQNAALTQYAQQIQKLTLTEERNRMARELHDTIGHTFTSVIMGMDAVSYLIKPAPDQAVQKLEVLRELTRKGLEEVRRNIHQIAPDEAEAGLSARLYSIANQFALHTNTQVFFHEEGESVALPNHVSLAFTRCLQEAITNAKRHGNASAIRVRLTYREDEIMLEIADNGLGSDDLVHGFGLKAMRDRMAEIQGNLQVESARGQGTVVRCIMGRRKPA